MMAQYRQIKSELPDDALLLFRLGDFYEMFLEDAQESASILEVALTQRGGMPMCGIPHHAADNYISKLLKAGRRVALCEQVEDAKPGQLVRREVTQILSPGTHLDERMLAAERNNYLATACRSGRNLGLAVADLTTGAFKTTEVGDSSELLAELERLRPAELVLPARDPDLQVILRPAVPFLQEHEDWVFESETAQHALKEHFGVKSLDGFGLKNRDAAACAAGGALHYLSQQMRRDVSHLCSLSFYTPHGLLTLDATTLRHLEILEPLQRDASRDACLYGVMNRTATPMGARLLRDWLTQPLADSAEIHQRQTAVQAWVNHPSLLEAFRRGLKEVRDLERTLTRLSIGSGNARDLRQLQLALQQMPALKELLQESIAAAAHDQKTSELSLDDREAPTSLLDPLEEQLAVLPELVDLIQRAVVDEPPLALKEGGIIRDGFNPQLDELRGGSREGKEWIAELQNRESERTGIPSLKVRFNNVFGYFIEVTRTHLDKVPPEWHRKQTIANGERYITDELKEMEGKVLGADERAMKMEYDLFLQLREAVIAQVNPIQQTARALGQLDVLAGFAEVARLHDYCRPRVGNEGRLEIRAGRHPVLEQAMLEERFVPNDLLLDGSRQLALITGPNMAGKSTYIRQAALLTLLAHTGSFVPATKARIDLVDRIFTRIGASDDLARGQSTFMVEMSETANILNHASRNSLVILDEIGRGTSTFDGLSLAWAIVEHLHNQLGAKTLFATHYHELTELEGRLERVFNCNVAVREYNDQIVFLRQIVEGAADQSYGIQVARLAGVPQEVLGRAREILGNLEESDLTPSGGARGGRKPRTERKKLRELPPSPQLDLFTQAESP
ncbi:MAG: DNA mismatch repair protein MutS [Verrucomicrobiales bacterium]|nr:DNA mismatch repair protein MutS [Verrucomicrobiales bacterium]